MKRTVFAMLIASIFLVTGCLEDDDYYSLSDMWVGFGIFQETESNANGYKIVMDNDDLLIPVTSNFNVFHYVEDGDRVLVNYTILDDNSGEGEEATEYYIKLNSVKKILMKGILDVTEENNDSIGNDPINVIDVWMTDSLLNFELKYWGSSKVHFINLVKQSGELTGDSQPVELELRHNNNGDDESIPYKAFVSFNLGELEISGLDSVQFRVTGTDYDNEEFDYDGVYHYGENSD
ncbi:hypothetical protein GM418_17935 [Maribellus comscasis]|uniref:NigD-like C-terminal beta sandwich domain-containing protein n=1 Tax=Maribellus comscasis TaxID=2681766 RepID=A0A6I6JSQ7_9BACT|nr:NigD-like protein [Maribellus comscasis]QGY45481.1 hypothetical protein GM418_17935 [Maribellus comscasis]